MAPKSLAVAPGSAPSLPVRPGTPLHLNRGRLVALRVHLLLPLRRLAPAGPLLETWLGLQGPAPPLPIDLFLLSVIVPSLQLHI